MRSSDSVAFTFAGCVPDYGAWAIPGPWQHCSLTLARSLSDSVSR
jgi:hypothetical protein